MSDDLLILETVVTTRNADGSANLAPMGPSFQRGNWQHCELRPFESSRTWRNLQEHPWGVIHITDDVSMLAAAAIGAAHPPFEMLNWRDDQAWILAGACRWYAFRAEFFQRTPPRHRVRCRIEDSGRLRDFVGFNRAQYAVVEAAILATRVGILEASHIVAEMERLRIPVQKTGGQQERQAFELLARYIRTQTSNNAP